MTTPTPHEILVEARRIVANPENWFQGYFHNDDDTAFCSLGAIIRAYDNLGHDRPTEMHNPAREVFDRVVGARYPEYIGRNMGPHANEDDDSVYVAQWNDTKGRLHEEVTEMFDAAIELAAARVDPL